MCRKRLDPCHGSGALVHHVPVASLMTLTDFYLKQLCFCCSCVYSRFLCLYLSRPKVHGCCWQTPCSDQRENCNDRGTQNSCCFPALIPMGLPLTESKSHHTVWVISPMLIVCRICKLCCFNCSSTAKLSGCGCDGGVKESNPLTLSPRQFSHNILSHHNIYSHPPRAQTTKQVSQSQIKPAVSTSCDNCDEKAKPQVSSVVEGVSLLRFKLEHSS
jgi:hypothetical protein